MRRIFGAALGWPHPEQLKPFFETLARWTMPRELAAVATVALALGGATMRVIATLHQRRPM